MKSVLRYKKSEFANLLSRCHDAGFFVEPLNLSAAFQFQGRNPKALTIFFRFSHRHLSSFLLGACRDPFDQNFR